MNLGSLKPFVGPALVASLAAAAAIGIEYKRAHRPAAPVSIMQPAPAPAPAPVPVPPPKPAPKGKPKKHDRH